MAGVARGQADLAEPLEREWLRLDCHIRDRSQQTTVTPSLNIQIPYP